MTKTLTGLMDPVFEAQYFLGRRITMKAIEHSLCEFDKYYRAVLENRSKRKYRGGGTKVAAQVSCALCEDKAVFCLVEDTWWLCARCTSLEYADLRDRATQRQSPA